MTIIEPHRPVSVFAEFEPQAWPYLWQGQIVIGTLVGGTPSSDRVTEGWVRKNLGWKNEDLIAQAVHEVMADRAKGPDGVVPDAREAQDELASKINLNGFKRDENGLYIEGRHLKACLKEAASIAVASGLLDKGRKWGKTQKGLVGFLAEHIFAHPRRLYLGRTEPDEVHQRFVHTFRGSGIQCEELAHDVVLDFEIETDWPFSQREWAMIWLKASRNGIGATRSQSYGMFTVTKWDQVR